MDFSCFVAITPPASTSQNPIILVPKLELLTQTSDHLKSSRHTDKAFYLPYPQTTRSPPPYYPNLARPVRNRPHSSLIIFDRSTVFTTPALPNQAYPRKNSAKHPLTSPRPPSEISLPPTNHFHLKKISIPTHYFFFFSSAKSFCGYFSGCGFIYGFAYSKTCG